MIITVKPSQLKTRLKQFISLSKPVLITGRPGIGKTDIITEAVNELGYDLIFDFPVVSDPTDYKGLPFAKVADAVFLPIGILKKMLNATTKTVVVFDDLGQAPGAVQCALMQIVLSRQINGHKIPNCVTFVAATNRREDSAGVSGFIEPLKSRFFIFKLESDLDDWVNWALRIPTFPLELIAAVRFRPEWVQEWKPSKDIINSPNPRNLGELGDVMANGIKGVDVYASRLGDAAAMELNAFMEMYSKLPNIQEIITNPEKAPIPDALDAKHAIASALTYKASDINFDAMSKYMERLPVEFESFFMTSISIRNRDLTGTKSYIKWAARNGNDITAN